MTGCSAGLRRWRSCECLFLSVLLIARESDGVDPVAVAGPFVGRGALRVQVDRFAVELTAAVDVVGPELVNADQIRRGLLLRDEQEQRIGVEPARDDAVA